MQRISERLRKARFSSLRFAVIRCYDNRSYLNPGKPGIAARH